MLNGTEDHYVEVEPDEKEEEGGQKRGGVYGSNARVVKGLLTQTMWIWPFWSCFANIIG